MAELGAIGIGGAIAQDEALQGPGAADAALTIALGLAFDFNVEVTNPGIILGATEGLRGAVVPNVQYFVSGVVKENDVPKRRLVRVYDRATGKLLNEEYSDGGSGRFNIVVENQSTAVFVMAFDDTTVGDDFNAQVYDLVLPKR